MMPLLYLAIALVTLFIVALFVGRQQSPPATPARASDPAPQPEAEPMKPDKTHRYRSAITGRDIRGAMPAAGRLARGLPTRYGARYITKRSSFALSRRVDAKFRFPSVRKALTWRARGSLWR